MSSLVERLVRVPVDRAMVQAVNAERTAELLADTAVADLQHFDYPVSGDMLTVRERGILADVDGRTAQLVYYRQRAFDPHLAAIAAPNHEEPQPQGEN